MVGAAAVHATVRVFAKPHPAAAQFGDRQTSKLPLRMNGPRRIEQDFS